MTISTQGLIYELRPNTFVRRTQVGDFWLSEQDVMILAAIAGGDSNQQIARQLGLCPHTVANKISRLYVRIGALNRATAAAFAVRHGLVP